MLGISQEEQVSIQAILTELETKRKKQWRNYKIYNNWLIRFVRKVAWFLTIIGLPALIPILTPIFLPIFLPGIIFLLVDLLLRHQLLKRPRNKFKERFKKEVLSRVMKELYPSFKYTPDNTISRKDLDATRIFHNVVKSYYGEDYVEGEIQGVPISFNEVNLFTKMRPKNFGHGIQLFFLGFASVILSIFMQDDVWLIDDRIRFFRGLIFRAEFHKTTTGSVIVIPWKRLKSYIYQGSGYKSAKKVMMDMPAFDSEYAVLSADSQLAFYVLTPSLMERLLALQATLQAEIYISVIDSQLSLAVQWEKDFFEADFEKGVPELASLEGFIQEIKFFEGLIEQLQQNVRIWGDKALQ